MINELHYVSCPLCGQDDYRVRYPATGARDKEKKIEHFCCTSHELAYHDDIVQCNVCGMVYTNPQPAAEKLIDIYKAVEDPLYEDESAARERTFLRSLKQLHRFRQPPGRMLDVGCYTGVFMKVAAQSGWKVDGLELSDWAAKKAQQGGWGTVFQQPIETIPTPGPYQLYDVVTLWDVIEHLVQPSEVLQEAGRLLKPGGVLAISTHMVDSWAVRLLGTRYPFFMDMHLVHFSQSTMKRLLQQNGYEWLGCKAHRRILRVGYFLEKLNHKMKFRPVRGLVRGLSRWEWLAGRFIGIGLLGLVNIFARKQ